MDRLLQILVNAAALWVAVLITPLEFVGEWWQLLVVALIFSLVNTYVRPILRIVSLPITIVTVGLFLLVINALMLMLTGAVSAELNLGFVVPDFVAALLGAIVVAVVGLILSIVVGSLRLGGSVF